MIELWGDIGFLVFTVSSLMFTILYLTMSRAWRKSFVGAAVGIFATSVTILCTYLALRIWEIDLPGVEYLRLVIFWVLGLTMLASVIGFLEIQFGRRGTRVRKRLARRYDDV